MRGQRATGDATEGGAPRKCRQPGPPPRSLTVGIGASRGVSGEEVLGLIKRVLHDAGLPVRAVAELATIDAKAGEPGLLCAADRLEVPLRTYPAGVLAGVDVPTPSQAPRAAVATPSVAEAAALVAAGAGGRLLVRKSTSVPSGGRTAPMATAAVAQISPDGRPEADRGGPGHHREHGGHDGCRHGQLDSKENQ